MNFVNLKPKKSMDYIVTGYWSDRAAVEAKKYGNVNLVLGDNKKFNSKKTSLKNKSLTNFFLEL